MKLARRRGVRALFNGARSVSLRQGGSVIAIKPWKHEGGDRFTGMGLPPFTLLATASPPQPPTRPWAPPSTRASP